MHKSLFVRCSLRAALMSVVAAAGCAGDPGSDPMMDDGEDGDTTAPAISSTIPAANQGGVAADTKINVFFNEQMDPATVLAAYSSSDLPAEQVSLNFDETGTVLTITPSTELLYAEGIGTDLTAVPAKTYSISIGTGAKDIAGNALAEPLALQFTTKRRLVATFPLDSALTRARVAGSFLGSSNDMWVGDNAVDATFRSYVTFDLSAFPYGSTVESAQFSSRQLAAEGAPYSLGAVMAYHVSFPTLNDIVGMQPISLPGMYSQDATVQSKVIDVTPQVTDDLANRATRNNRSQYMLQIDQATNANATVDKAVFAKGTFEMTAVYVVD